MSVLVTKSKRLVGDSYSADPDDLDKLREIAAATKLSKAELIRLGVKLLISQYGRGHGITVSRKETGE